MIILLINKKKKFRNFHFPNLKNPPTSQNPQILLSMYKMKHQKYSRIRRRFNHRSHLTILAIDNRRYLCKSEHRLIRVSSRRRPWQKRKKKRKRSSGFEAKPQWRIGAGDITWLLYLSARFLPIFLCLVEARLLNGYENYYRHRRSTSGDYLSTPDR